MSGPAITRLAILVTVLAAASVNAATPVLNIINPRGGQRGSDMTLTLLGSRLKDAQEILFYTPGFKVNELKAVSDSNVEAKITIAADCQLGEHKMRIRSATGLSEVRTFWVGQYPTVNEKEPNSDFDKPQKIDFNSTVDGFVANEDVDYYLFEAKKGQRISAEIEGVRLGMTLFDTYVAIQNMGRFELASSDDTALLLQDSVASVIAPEDGTYVVQVRESSYGGNGNCRYRLHVGSFPRPMMVYPAGGKKGEKVEVTYIKDVTGPIKQTLDVPAQTSSEFGLFAQQDGQFAPSPNTFRIVDFGNVMEAEPNNQRDKASKTDQTVPLAFNGIIEKESDVDWFRFNAKKGQRFSVRCHARSVRSPLDSVMSVHDANGKQLASNDDAGGPDSAFNWNPPADGEYLLRVRDHLYKGGEDYVYRVEFSPIEPTLSVNVPRYGRYGQARQVIPVPKGNRYATMINASRSNFGGDLVIEAPGLSAGLTLNAPTMPANISSFPIVFEAAADAPLAGALVRLGARHADEKKKISGSYSQNIDLVAGPPNQTVFYRTHIDRIPVAVTEEAPFTIDIVQPKVPLVQGGAMDLKVVAKRKEGFDKAITLRMLWNPPGVGSKTTVVMPKGKSEVLYPINANSGAQTRTWQIAILAESNNGHGELLTSSKLTPLTVAPPFVKMKLEMAAIEKGKAGEIIAKIEQLKAFEGKAKVTLHGLPNKATTVAKEISKDDKELVFPVKTENDVRVGKHKRLFCRVIVTQSGEQILHGTGQWGTLRIDNPPPPPKPKKKKVAAKPKAKPKPKPAPVAAKPTPKPVKRLTRLEKIRLEAEKRARGE